MSLWFVSDCHFNHKNICLYAGRPFASVEKMDRHLIDQWNARVKPNDDVWHLGDFAFVSKYSDLTKLIHRLNGRIHMILGNHDKMIIQNQQLLLEDGKVKSIQHYKELKVDGQLIVLFHFGLRTWLKNYRGSIHLYGHSHSKLPPLGKSVDVGVDCKEITSEYRPVSLSEVLVYMSKREFVATDFHGMEDRNEDNENNKED